MSAMTIDKPSTFLGEGKIRMAIFACLALVAVFLILGRYIPYIADAVSKINGRSDAIYSALFTFLSVFWAAALTIWSLLKSRATRYVERLAENVRFQEYMAVLEVRLLIAFAAIIFSFVIYIVSPTLTVPATGQTYLCAAWAIAYMASVLLLIDSLLTARVLL